MQITENLKNLLESLYIVLEDYSPKIEIVSEKEFSDAGENISRFKNGSTGTRLLDETSNAIYEELERKVWERNPHYDEKDTESICEQSDKFAEEIFSLKFFDRDELDAEIQKAADEILGGYDEILNFQELVDGVSDETNFECWFFQNVANGKFRRQKCTEENFFPVWMPEEMYQDFSEFLFDYIFNKFKDCLFGVRYPKEIKNPKLEDCVVSPVE